MRNWKMWTGALVTLVVLPTAFAKAFGPEAIWPWFTVLAGSYVCAGLVHGFGFVNGCFRYAFEHKSSRDLGKLIKHLAIIARPRFQGKAPEYTGEPDALIDFAMKLHGERMVSDSAVTRLIQQKSQALADHSRHKAEQVANLSQWPLVFGVGAAFVTLVGAFLKVSDPNPTWAQDSYMHFGLLTVVAGLCGCYILLAPFVESVREVARNEMLKARLCSQVLPLVSQGANPVEVMEEVNSLLDGEQVPAWEEVLEAMKEKAA